MLQQYVKYPLSLRNVEDLLAKREIDICHETVRFWWNRFGRRCQTSGTALSDQRGTARLALVAGVHETKIESKTT